jgi:hypothetical protein
VTGSSSCPRPLPIYIHFLPSVSAFIHLPLFTLQIESRLASPAPSLLISYVT